MASKLLSVYLTLYNSIHLVLWIALVLMVPYYKEMRMFAIPSVQTLILFAHRLMLLDIVHGILGFVKTGLMASLMQVLLRNTAVFLLIDLQPEVLTLSLIHI